MPVNRIYIPGQEWVYYKIYCGTRTSDSILTDTILPFAQELVEKGWVKKWFFIRYTDPDYHLRIRFLLDDTQYLGNLMLSFQEIISSYVEDDIIYKIQNDTYIRELERYGAENIEASETLFYHESDMLVKAMDLIEDDNLYFNFILKAIDRLLDDFNYDIDEKIHFATLNRNAFWDEFNGNKILTKQLDKKYRAHKDAFTHFLTSKIEEFAPLDELLYYKSSVTKPIIQDVTAYLDKENTQSSGSLLSSYIHMMVNRAFRSKQRFYELVCYDFLMKFYQYLKHHKNQSS